MQSPHVVIHKRAWHYRLFWWSLNVVDDWRGCRGEYAKRYEYGTTLFHYLRIILFWMPLAIASSVACYVGMFFLLVVAPVEIKSIFEYIGFLACLTGAFMVYQMLRMFSVKLLEEPDFMYWKRHFPGAFVLVRKYISAKVDGSTPLITFVGSKKK